MTKEQYAETLKQSGFDVVVSDGVIFFRNTDAKTASKAVKSIGYNSSWGVTKGSENDGWKANVT